MLDALKALIDRVLPPQGAAAPTGHTLELATAVLLVEVMRADGGLDATEQDAVVDALRRHCHLADDEAAQLAAVAHDTARDAGDFFAFTSRLNERLDMPQKIAVVESMWGVAFADGVLSAHEQHLMRRVADLLHLPHGAHMHAKMRARAAAGLAPDPAP